MLLQDAYTILGRKVALDATLTDDKTRMRDALDEAAREIFRRTKMISMLETADLTLTDGVYWYWLDHRVLYGLNFRTSTSDAKLEVWPRRKFDENYPDPDTTNEQEPTLIIPWKKSWVIAQPTAASTVSFTSTSGSDITTYYAVVRGIVSGRETAERVTLTGASAALTTNSYTSLISITKDTTNGTVTATTNSGAVTVQTLLPGDKERCCWQVRVHPVPDTTYTCPYTFYRKPWGTTLDEEPIPIDEVFSDVLLCFAQAILLEQQGDQKWETRYQLAEKKLGELMDITYFSDDEDERMQLVDLDQGGWD